mmetsp:Transcript_4837/g.14656  ORF Transcript_4837/g.14656 Transcript_4837/m.14656 type:complete len:224 (+) Transcript_4837:811-1482(+)
MRGNGPIGRQDASARDVHVGADGPASAGIHALREDGRALGVEVARLGSGVATARVREPGGGGGSRDGRRAGDRQVSTSGVAGGERRDRDLGTRCGGDALATDAGVDVRGERRRARGAPSRDQQATDGVQSRGEEGEVARRGRLDQPANRGERRWEGDGCRGLPLVSGDVWQRGAEQVGQGRGDEHKGQARQEEVFRLGRADLPTRVRPPRRRGLRRPRSGPRA